MSFIFRNFVREIFVCTHAACTYIRAFYIATIR